MPMRGHYNVSGANKTSTWQTGYPYAVDYARGFPKACLRTISKIPIINIDPKENMTSLMATVNIPAAVAGIECDGAAVRMDGLPLYLKKVVDPPEGFLPDRDILRRIYEGLLKEVGK